MPPREEETGGNCQDLAPQARSTGGYQASDGSTHEYKIGDKASRIKARAAALAPKKAAPKKVVPAKVAPKKNVPIGYTYQAIPSRSGSASAWSKKVPVYAP